jgi:hypothetical protein
MKKDLGMIYYRSERGSRDFSVELVRIVSATSLITYPAGGLLLALGPNSLVNSLAGYGLILLSLVAYAPLIGSTIQRIVGEETKALDGGTVNFARPKCPQWADKRTYKR